MRGLGSPRLELKETSMTRFLPTLLAAALAAPSLTAAAPVTVKGSDTMVILAQRWAEEYMKANAGKSVQVTGGGSGTGIAALINGTTEIATASRAMKDAEKKQVEERHRVKPVETAVAKDGVAFYVNAANAVDTLTVEQLRRIYVGDVENWKDVGGPDAPIVLYSRENSSGTYVFVKEEVLGKEDYSQKAQTLPGTAAVVNAVAKERYGIGYGGAAYAKGVKELKVTAKPGEPGVQPTKENVLSGKYPLSRNLFMYTRGEPRGDAKAFLEFVLSPAGQGVVEKVGYYPVK
jgi:phosphate transport system substrate-binding protein